MHFEVGHEYTLLNKEQWDLLFGNDRINMDHSVLDNSCGCRENWLGKKVKATYKYAAHPTKEEGGDGCIYFSPTDTLEYYLENTSFESNTYSVDYYHSGDTYYKRKTFNYTEKTQNKLLSLS